MGDKEKRILLLAGPGNNGGDALVAARHLKRWWFDVTVVFTGIESKLPRMRKPRWPAGRRPAAQCTNPFQPAGTGTWSSTDCSESGWSVRSRRYAELVNLINATGIRVLAIDIPSGLHADSGRVLGCAVRAHHTLTFIGLKPGLLTLDGPEPCG